MRGGTEVRKHNKQRTTDNAQTDNALIAKIEAHKVMEPLESDRPHLSRQSWSRQGWKEVKPSNAGMIDGD